MYLRLHVGRCDEDLTVDGGRVTLVKANSGAEAVVLAYKFIDTLKHAGS